MAEVNGKIAIVIVESIPTGNAVAAKAHIENFYQSEDTKGVIPVMA